MSIGDVGHRQDFGGRGGKGRWGRVTLDICGARAADLARSCFCLD